MELQTPLRRWAHRLLLDRHAEHWLGQIDASLSLSEIRARVTGVIAETPDTRTFVLRPNRHWRGHLPGQYTTVEVEVDGVRVRRCYSIASAPSDSRLSITVKRVPGGLVSGWLHDRVRSGDVLGLGPAAGEFVLPDPDPGPLLLYSGGSGITPVMSILRDLSARGAVGDVVFVHHARSAGDVIFASELRKLDARHPGLRVRLRLDERLPPDRRFDEAWIAREIPDFRARTTMLCGPPGLMARVEELWQRVGAGHRLRRERFTAPAPARRAGPEARASVYLSRGDRRIEATSARPLLEQLERAGERPAHGCRMGICNSCACVMRRGRVRNLRTGAVSSGPDTEIRLCVTAPETDLVLDL